MGGKYCENRAAERKNRGKTGTLFIIITVQYMQQIRKSDMEHREKSGVERQGEGERTRC